MKTIYKIWIGFILFVIISAGIFSIWWEYQKEEMYHNSYRSDYNFDVDLSIGSPINNVTLYIPLPILDNASSAGQSIVNTSYSGPRSKWKNEIVETEYGPMLSMKIDYFKPRLVTKGEGPDTYPLPLVFGTRVSAEHAIDTKDPIGKEPLLMPELNLTHLGKVTNHRDADVYSYDTKVYAFYDTSPNASVWIDISLYGTNEWWIGGWQSNSYRDHIQVELLGSQNGWVLVEGEIVSGEGTYPEMGS